MATVGLTVSAKKIPEQTNKPMGKQTRTKRLYSTCDYNKQTNRKKDRQTNETKRLKVTGW